jgi:tetratricopeptide (TPR) repeat protein
MNNYSNALDDFKQASLLKPNEIKIKHILGLCYHKLNKLYESIRVLSETINNSNNNENNENLNKEQNNTYQLLINNVQVSRANVYVDFGHRKGFEKALSDLQHVLFKDPTHINARINLAYLLQMNGNYMKSWTQFTICINLYPKYSLAYEGRSIVCLQMKDFNASLKDINQAIRLLSSNRQELFVNRGVIYQYLGDNINAMRDYQTAILCDPYYSLAYFNSANIYLLSKQYQQALFNYNKCIQQCNLNDETVYQNRAIVNTILGNYTQALDDFNKAIKFNKYSSSIYMNRGLLLFKLKCFKDAELDFTNAIQLTKYDSLLYKLRGDCRAKLKMNDDAMNDFKMSINLYDKNFILVKS